MNPTLDRFILGVIMLVALLLPLNLLATQPLHHDEALYGTWALRIASGQDVWLTQTPVDKPPLFLYILALTFNLLGATPTTARLPSLLASVITISMIYELGRAWYGRAVGLLAAWLLALSPFSLMLAPTALTDPLMVMMVMLSLLMATQQHPLSAGLCLGLAVATKQQGLFFLPLVMGVFQISNFKFQSVTRFSLGFALICLLLLLWDAHRTDMQSFLTRSSANYGGLYIDMGGFIERGQSFIELLNYSTALPMFNLITLLGWILFLGITWRSEYPAWFMDRHLTLFCSLFLIGHASLSFQVWDRYLLGLMPLLALLTARVWLIPLRLQIGVTKQVLWRTASSATPIIYYLLLIIWLSYMLWLPVQDAVQGRYPLGSQSQALQGIEQIVAYLQGHVNPPATLYHRWLGTHWRFYLWDYPYDLQYWDSPQSLAAKAQAGHFIAFPTWQSETEARLALAQKGLSLHEVTRAYNERGGTTIILYRIEGK